jgi:hypothetical protein
MWADRQKVGVRVTRGRSTEALRTPGKHETAGQQVSRPGVMVVAKGVEPPTFRFSGRKSPSEEVAQGRFRAQERGCRPWPSRGSEARVSKSFSKLEPGRRFIPPPNIPSRRISLHCRYGPRHYSCRCRRRASSTSTMTWAGIRPRTGPMRSTVTERTCSARAFESTRRPVALARRRT